MSSSAAPASASGHSKWWVVSGGGVLLSEEEAGTGGASTTTGSSGTLSSAASQTTAAAPTTEATSCAPSTVDDRVDDRVDDGADDRVVPLSPFDVANRGRAVPMVWFFRGALDTDRLLAALQRALREHYPVLLGRYEANASAVRLFGDHTGAKEGRSEDGGGGASGGGGVRVEVWDAPDEVSFAEAVGRFGPVSGLSSCKGAAGEVGDERSRVSYFPRAAHEQFVPLKQGMDPDPGTAECPLLAVKITRFASADTAIGLLMQHGVADGDAEIAFMRGWAALFRGDSAIAPQPDHSRATAEGLRLGTSSSSSDKTSHRELSDRDEVGTSSDFPKSKHADFLKIIAPGEPNVPAFAHLMPQIMGPAADLEVCVVGFSGAELRALKEASGGGAGAQGMDDSALSDRVSVGGSSDQVQRQTPATGPFGPPFVCSTDDALTAATWRALCKMRCRQLGIDMKTTALKTTLLRAVNVRKRTAPPLGPGYFGNGVCTVKTSLPVRELLGESADLAAQSAAPRLRRDLEEQGSADAIAGLAQWLAAKQTNGCKAVPRFDEHAMTFIVSSWLFDWEGAVFSSPSIAEAGEPKEEGEKKEEQQPGEPGRPLCFDHGALLPIVGVFTPRPGGDGVNVWTSGPRASLEDFAEELVGARTA